MVAVARWCGDKPFEFTNPQHTRAVELLAVTAGERCPGVVCIDRKGAATCTHAGTLSDGELCTGRHVAASMAFCHAPRSCWCPAHHDGIGDVATAVYAKGEGLDVDAFVAAMRVWRQASCPDAYEVALLLTSSSDPETVTKAVYDPVRSRCDGVVGVGVDGAWWCDECPPGTLGVHGVERVFFCHLPVGVEPHPPCWCPWHDGPIGTVTDRWLAR